MSNHQEEDIAGDLQQSSDSKFQIQALLGEMRRMMRAELELIHERLDRAEARTPREQQHEIPIRQQDRRVPRRNVEEEAESVEFEELYLNRNRFERVYGNREARIGKPRRDNDLGSIKIKIPSFQGKNDLEAYCNNPNFLEER